MVGNIKLISWNVNGIRAAEKKGFLDWFVASAADVICVQETKAHPDQLSEALHKPLGYSSAFAAAEKKGYSGVCTWTRLPVSRTIIGLGDPQFDNQGRTLVSEFERFVLLNIYFPNGGRGPEYVQHKLDFYAFFLKVATRYMNQGRSVIVCGDTNTAYAEIDLSRPKENVRTSGFMPSEREGQGEFYKAGLIDTFRLLHPGVQKFSWWDQVSRARERGATPRRGHTPRGCADSTPAVLGGTVQTPPGSRRPSRRRN